MPPAPSVSSVRFAHKFAKPPSPNLDNLRCVLTERLTPVQFYLINDTPKFTNWVWDQHFKGICLSPKFEGKSTKQMLEMVEACCREVGMEGRVHLICQPPSRWHKMKRLHRRRWTIDQ